MFSERIERLSGSLIREILAAAQRPEVISFAGGLPASTCLPPLDFPDVPPALAQYGTSEGEPELREQIAKDVARIGLSCDASQVLVLSGSQQALDLAAKLFVDPGTPVITEGPTYLAALQVFRLFGAAFHTVEQQDGQLPAATLQAAIADSKAKLAYLIPTFQNPSGACYSVETRQALARVLDEAHLPVIEDDPYRALSYDGDAPAPLVTHLKSAPWIYCGSFSKTLAPGLRIGYLIASKELMPHLLKLKQAVDLHSNRLGQWFIAQWLKSGDYPAHLNRLQQNYKVGRDAMQAALERHFSDLADWQVPQGGLFFWLTLKNKRDTRTFLKPALEQHNVAFMPGEAFYADPDTGIGHLRLNFSHATPERIEEGIARLAGLIRAG
ncbi:aminotransferase-like domain-containing protein [Pseudogulbenkiania subflava]|uniref:Putative 8-amino-7-oxononanoate synthase n=1 Tax=Pseudogulbenkiania subflava DSM 22618 TaxID=1123014 RepID=A0A1Y6BPB3_9NEIS|nr:PLP-dependent aminotransferase family protein [Pseudogulbenkiania subflava]SMF20529.1 DNA-binding transcriptional regulator, MocR family, contains an aminotransferase domain [Pseudogulbenkiania subflava DSM 22618]